MKEIKFILLGLGTVGRGFLQLLLKKQAWLRQAAKVNLKLVGLATKREVLHTNHAGASLEALKALAQLSLPTSPSQLRQLKQLSGVAQVTANTGNAVEELIRTTAAQVVFEAIPTNMNDATPAIHYLRSALSSGKSVVTANKAPVVFFYDELHQLAAQHQVGIRFEAAVLSGTPVFSLLSKSLAGLQFSSLAAILNGTTNFILSEMEKGKTYAAALTEAQRLGYAEADPSYDVNGLDSVAKLLILAKAYFGLSLKKEAVSFEGITALTPAAVQQAKLQGKKYRLISHLALGEKEGTAAKVELAQVPATHPFFSVNGNQNALCLNTDLLGTLTIIGPGAGELPTAYGLFTDFFALLSEGKL